jgi:hypothetical protein
MLKFDLMDTVAGRQLYDMGQQKGAINKARDMLLFDLQSVSIISKINVKGMGKRQSLRLATPWKLPKNRIYALSRRVEF